MIIRRNRKLRLLHLTQSFKFDDHNYRMNMEEKRRRLKKEGRPLYIEEDDPVKFKLAVSILTMKLFADQERK